MWPAGQQNDRSGDDQRHDQAQQVEGQCTEAGSGRPCDEIADCDQERRSEHEGSGRQATDPIIVDDAMIVAIIVSAEKPEDVMISIGKTGG